MKHLNAEKYNLAWFKLAECVSRGEKERALGVYRLLSHSVGSDALAKQLFGDLLLCFNEKERAIQQYKQAAETYKKRGKIIESIAIYEHLLTLNPHDEDDMFDLCALYAQSQLGFKIAYHVGNLLQKSKLDFALKLVKKYDDMLSDIESLQVHCEVSLVCIRDKTISRDVVLGQLEKVLDKLAIETQKHLLQDFLLKVELEDESYHQHAREYLQK